MKKASTKRSLLISVISLLLCFTMLLGTTLAWFTDEVTSAGNKIQAGTLKLDLLLLDQESGEWNSLKKDKNPIFNYDRWEPGYVDVKVLQVKNLGDLALKWVATFVSEKPLSILTDVIDVYVCPSASELGYPADRDLSGYTLVGNLTQFINTLQQTTYGTLEAEQSAYLGIALKMRESAGNEYQGLSLGGAFDIRIAATQWTGANESDSFDNQYDKEATYPALFDNLEMEASIEGKVDADNKLAEQIVLRDSDYGVVVTIPVGTLIAEGTEQLTLKINKDNVNANVTLDQTVGYDVVVEGVAEGNTAPITVLMPRVMPKGQTAIQMYHDGNMMQRVYTAAELIGKSGDNDTYGDKFLYDAESGDVTFSLTHFSNVSMGSTTKVMVMGKEIVGIEIDLSNPGEYLVDGKITIPADGNVYVISHARTDTTTKNELSLTLTHSWHNINPGEMCTNSIVMQKGAKVVLNGVNIRNSADDALRIEPSNQSAQTYIYVADGTQNWLTGRSGIGFGTYVYADVYVEGYGTLYTTAMGWGSPGIGVDAHTEGDGNKMHFNVSFLRSIPMNAAAGIGGGFAGKSWRGLALVEINGGTYQCYRGGDAASIGCGLNGHFGDIVINAGTVYCYTNPWTAYGRNLGRGMYAGSCTGIYVSKDATVYAWNYSSGYGLWVPGDVYVPSGMKQDASVVVNGFEPMNGIASVDAVKVYTVGQDIVVNGVTIDYRDVADEVKTSGFTVSDVDMSFGGKKTVFVTYTENGNTVTGSFVITVTDTLNAVSATPKKLVYKVGESAEFTVNAVAPDGTRSEVTGYTISGADTSTAGIKTVTITFGNKSTTCEINVINITSLDGANDQQDTHALFWYLNHQFKLGGVSSSATVDYNSYLGKTYTGTNGELATGFNNSFAYTYPHAGSPNEGNALVRGDAQYGLNIFDALPYTYVGIRCIAGFDAKILGFGYYVDGNVDTLTYNAPLYYSEKVLVDPGYQQFLDLGGQYTAEANTTVCLGDLGFAAGSSHTITWVVVFEDGYQTLADWNINMKSSFAATEFFKDTDKPNANLIVLAGQSNATGVAPITFDMQVKYNSVNYKNIFMQYKNVWLPTSTVDQNEKFETYYYGMGAAYPEYFGPDAALAYYLATTPGLKDETWFIIKYTAPGTGLELHWLNNNNLAADMMTYVEGCIGGLSDQYDVQVHSLLWMQGENDALVEDIAGRYAVNEQTFVTMFRNKFAKYATLPNDQIAGSGIAFISAAIAPAGKDGNDWVHATAVNEAKRDNAYIWYAPGSIGKDSILYDYRNDFFDNDQGGKSGSIINPNATYGIYNSVFIDTSLMSVKADDVSHYNTQSMEWLGTWFAQYVEHMMDAELPAPPPSQTNTNTIYLNANGGVVGSDRLEVEAGGTVTLPTPTRDGYYFDGWYDIDGNKVDASYKPTGTVLLTAKWGNRQITVQNNISGVTVSGVVNNQVANAGDIIEVTVTNNSARPVIFDFYDSTNNTLLYREIVAVGASSLTVPYGMGANVLVAVTNAHLITVNNSASNVIVTGIQNNQGVATGTVIVATVQNNTANQIKFAFVNETTGDAIWVSTVEAGASVQIPYEVGCDVSLTIYEQHTITVKNNTSYVTVSNLTSGQTAYEGTEITFTIKNTSSAKTVTVKDSYGNTLYSKSLSRNSTANVTLKMQDSDVTVTIS